MVRTLVTGSQRSRAASVFAGAWYPCAFGVDLAAGQLMRVQVNGVGYVVYRTGEDAVAALRDLCPHRAARLSDGRLVDGSVECGYHGWRFRSDGVCEHIPQLEHSCGIPDRATVAAVPARELQGIVWIRPERDAGLDDAGLGGSGSEGISHGADEDAIPLLPEIDWPGCRTVDFSMDLPYGDEFLIENVLDYAHIHVAHDRTRGGGKRELAGPLAFEFGETTARGFLAALGASRGGRPDPGPNLRRAEVEFAAPGLVHYRSLYKDGVRFSGLALYAVPLTEGRCRLFYRAYGNHWTWRDRIRPRFWEHGSQCDLLEEDMAVIVGQAAEIRASKECLASMWLPLKSSDAAVLKYREWIDRYASARAGSVGLRGRAASAAEGMGTDRGVAAAGDGRWALHGQYCVSCSNARRWCVGLARAAMFFGLLSLGGAAAAPGAARWWCLAIAVVCGVAYVLARGLQRRLVSG